MHKPLIYQDEESFQEVEDPEMEVGNGASKHSEKTNGDSETTAFDPEKFLSTEDEEQEGEKVTNDNPVRRALLSAIGGTQTPQAVALGIVMVIIVIASFAFLFPDSSKDVNLPPLSDYIDIIATVVFTVEYCLRIATAANIRSYVLSFIGIVDLISFLPLYLEVLAKATASGVNLDRCIRLMRVLRLVRFLKLFHYMFVYKRIIPVKDIVHSPQFKYLMKHKDVIHHIWAETYEQIKAVLPICLYATLYTYVVLGTEVQRLLVILGGQIAVIVGLFLFLEGLKLSIMPIGEYVSGMLPRYVRLVFVMIAAFVLGIIVTYAEPAIAALSILGGIVDRNKSPYLSYLLAEWTQPLTFFVGVGVGLAAAVGVLRVRYNWTLKNIIFVSIIPCLAITFVSQWLLPDLKVVIGLAWDCGAVTTGPVTVPVVLALGSGVAQSMGTAENVAASTFGIVTLASLFPIVTVQILALMAYFSVSEQSIKENVVSEGDASWPERTPYRETINGVRAIAPAVVFFFLLGRFVLRQKISQLIVESVTPEGDELSRDDTHIELSAMSPAQLHLGGEILEDIPDDDESEGPNATAEGKRKKKIRVFWIGVVASLVGMCLFNYGITFGLAELGEQVGEDLPGTFTELESVPDSPQYSYPVGISIIATFALVLGYLCTQAEPGLIVFGEKVQQLKIMPKRTLVVSVAAGVAVGMAVGVLKIAFKHDLIYYILVTYSIALVMTFFSDDQVVCVAWDSAGVTTGEITVSFILVLGVSLAKASDAIEGFGILTMASVGPIISVLISGFIERLKKKLNH